MKKVLLGAMVVALVVIGAFEGRGSNSELLDFVPRNSSVLFFINLEDFFQSQAVQGVRDENIEVEAAMQDLEKKLAPFQVTPDQLCRQVLIGANVANMNVAALFLTDLPEDKCKDVLNAMQADESGRTVSEMETNGRKVFVSTVNPNDPAELANAPALTYVTPNIVLATQYSQVGAVLSGLGKVLPRDREVLEVAEDMPQEALFFFVLKTPSGAQREAMPPNPLFNMVDLLQLYGKLTGDNGRDVELDSTIYCRDLRGSSTLATQLQASAAMITTMVFSDEPDLGRQLLECIKISRDREDVTVKVKVPEALGSEVADYIAYKGTQMQKNGENPLQMMPLPGLAPAENAGEATVTVEGDGTGEMKLEDLLNEIPVQDAQ